MAVSAKWFGLGLQKSLTSTGTDDIEWTTDTIKASLVTSSYAPNQDTDNYANLAGFSGNKVGTDQTLGSKTLTYDAASNTVRLKAGDPSWSALSATFRYVVIWKDSGAAATSPLLGYIDLGGDNTFTGGTFTLTLDATDGVLRLVAA